MAQLLGNVAVGTVLKLNENGVAQNYIVVHQGLPSSMYDASCSGTWLLRQNIAKNSSWSSGSNQFTTSYIRDFALLSVFQSFDQSIQSVIKTVKIPYCVGGGSSQVNSGANGYSCKLFLLGGYEVGFTQSDYSALPVDGSKLSYFISGTSSEANNKRVATLNASNTGWWLRSPNTSSNSWVAFIAQNGVGNVTAGASGVLGIRPAMVMPTNLIVDDSNNITVNQLVPPSSITVPSITMQQQTIPVSWTPVSVSGYDVTHQLQRNINNGGWQNIGSPISQTSYTDTAQSGWTQVQYQVAPVIDGAVGSYTQSLIIPVSDPAVLVISGQDGNLGTLTSNLPYTVTSNTGNPISLTRTVNGAQVVTLTVDSGFAYNIPIADLPTGTGTIIITASVEDSSQQIQTATRTWTYYKTPINIPSTGGIAQLTQNGQNIWPVTVPDAVEAPVYLGGNLNAALNKLGQAALYTKIGSPKYSEVTVDLSKVSVGDEVLLPENGVMVPFYVSSLNYEPTLNTSGDRVLLVRKNVYDQQKWNSTSVNTYANSTVDIWLNGTYKNLLDSSIQSTIESTDFYYTPGSGNNTVATLSREVFLLSLTELGFSDNTSNVEGSALPNASTIKIAYTDDSLPVNQWTRSPVTYNVYSVYFLYSTGNYSSVNVDTYQYVRPCFTLPTTFSHTYFVDSNNNAYPSQEYTTGGSITDVFGYDVPICQIQEGTYQGTGTFGTSMPSTLTLPFIPKFVCITNQTNPYIRAIIPYGAYGIVWNQNTATSTAISSFGLSTTWNQDTITWYNTTNAQLQLNETGITYNYVAFG